MFSSVKAYAMFSQSFFMELNDWNFDWLLEYIGFQIIEVHVLGVWLQNDETRWKNQLKY